MDGTGGFSSYPTMVVAYPVDWTGWWTPSPTSGRTPISIFRPLGWHYGDSGGMRTINETVASIVGDEIGRLAVERFYPERMPPAGWPRPLSMRDDWLGTEATRRHSNMAPSCAKPGWRRIACWLKAKSTRPRAYMEPQRRILVENGYTLRKLNQAYFAFHGSYAVGSAATDPIGGKLRLLRRQADSLADFLRTVARFSEPGDLNAALAANRTRTTPIDPITAFSFLVVLRQGIDANPEPEIRHLHPPAVDAGRGVTQTNTDSRR